MNKVRKALADWVAVDWGTSNLRYWIMLSNKVRHFGHKSLGMIHLNQKDYEQTLIKEIEEFLDSSNKTPILICGMAGSLQGWKEAPYLTVPCMPPNLKDTIEVECRDPRISVKILPGLKQDNPSDIMRGEETQIKGFLVQKNYFDGVVCLPGTHTKWVKISAGEIISFQTYMTGELFYLLSEESVLKYSIEKLGWDQTAFIGDVKEMMADSKLLGAKLFSLRAKSILRSVNSVESKSTLSGYLIGLELAGSRPYWLGEEVCILGNNEICVAYETALNSQGVRVERHPDEEISLKGLKSIYNSTDEIL